MELSALFGLLLRERSLPIFTWNDQKLGALYLKGRKGTLKFLFSNLSERFTQV